MSAVDDTYLPFSLDQLKNHFAPTASSGTSADKWAVYYAESAQRYQSFKTKHPRLEDYPLSKLRGPCQIQKDERFWTAACLMSYYYAPDRTSRLADVLQRAYGPRPPFDPGGTWKGILEGDLRLYFEVDFPSFSYQGWLRDHFDERNIIPYLKAAAWHRKKKRIKDRIEGSTQVDAVFVNTNTGFCLMIEAKVLSDISCQVSFDMLRNQLARTIDVMLEPPLESLPGALRFRNPQHTLFLLVSPRLFYDNPASRHYGLLANEYRDNPAAIGRDLPHRQDQDWTEISRRFSWLAWEDLNEGLPGACRWLQN